MDRIELIRQLVKKGRFGSYLEIGTQKGISFFPVKCKTKIAVDPQFLFSNKKRLRWNLKNPYNLFNKYFEMTSDEFFEKEKSYLSTVLPIDVVLIDGLHTFSASLKDVLNSIQYLNENGVIIMHDCMPPHKAAAFPSDSFPSPEMQEAIDGWNGEWCGDVWKTIVYLRRKYPTSLNSLVINTDCGLGIVTISEKITDFSIDQDLFDEVNELTYTEMIKNKESWLGIKGVEYSQELINSIK